MFGRDRLVVKLYGEVGLNLDGEFSLVAHVCIHTYTHLSGGIE